MTHHGFEIAAVCTAIATLLWTLTALGYEDLHAILRHKRSPRTIGTAQWITVGQMLLWAILLGGILLGEYDQRESLEVKGAQQLRLVISSVGLAVNLWSFLVLVSWVRVVPQWRWIVYSAIPGALLHCAFWFFGLWTVLQ